MEWMARRIGGVFMFNSGLKIGQIIKNADIVGIFKCGNMGGMRRSRTTNTLVIVSDYTKGLYHDKRFYIIQAWANQVTKTFIRRRMPHWLSLIIMELMFICLKL